MVAGGFDRDNAGQWLREGPADVIAGRKFLANPDLPDDPTTYCGGDAKGYTDYPSLAQERGEQPKSCVDLTWR